ncbi:hypothetical protein ACTG9Q_27870 [Actinokineospora sp. 24-640]
MRAVVGRHLDGARAALGRKYLGEPAIAVLLELLRQAVTAVYQVLDTPAIPGIPMPRRLTAQVLCRAQSSGLALLSGQ